MTEEKSLKEEKKFSDEQIRCLTIKDALLLYGFGGEDVKKLDKGAAFDYKGEIVFKENAVLKVIKSQCDEKWLKYISDGGFSNNMVLELTGKSHETRYKEEIERSKKEEKQPCQMCVPAAFTKDRKDLFLFREGDKLYLRSDKASVINHDDGWSLLSELGPPFVLRPVTGKKVVVEDMCRTCNLIKEGQMKCCSRCKKVMYCSRDCQKANWRFHKKDCM